MVEVLGPARSTAAFVFPRDPCACVSSLLDRSSGAALLLPRLDAASQAGPSVLIVQRRETNVPPEFAQQGQRPVLIPFPQRRHIPGMLGGVAFDAEFEDGKSSRRIASATITRTALPLKSSNGCTCSA